MPPHFLDLLAEALRSQPAAVLVVRLAHALAPTSRKFRDLLAQRLGAASVMATLWPVADNSTPWLMREFYGARQSGNGLTKAEAFRQAQLALLNGTAQTNPLPDAQKGPSSSVQIVIVPADGKAEGAPTRGVFVSVSEKDTAIFKRDVNKPFAHPYYWAPFILIGNWQ